MRAASFAAIVLIAASAGEARAKLFNTPDWFRQAQGWVESLLGERPSDREVVAPSSNIDPKMVLVPPEPRGTMRIIRPPDRPSGDRSGMR